VLLRSRSAHENTKTRYGANTRPIVRVRADHPGAIGVLTIGNGSLQIGDSLEPQPADLAFLPPTGKWCKMRLSSAEDG
jgi:hypothetical protein